MCSIDAPQPLNLTLFKTDKAKNLFKHIQNLCCLGFMGNKQAGPCVDANGKTLDSVEEEEVVFF